MFYLTAVIKLGVNLFIIEYVAISVFVFDILHNVSEGTGLLISFKTFPKFE